MRRCTDTRAWGLVTGVALLAALGCSRDHDALALKNRGGEGGASGGSAGSAGKGGTGPSRGGSSSGGSSGTPPRPPMEPPGRSVTSLMHGVVDAERVAFCFARVDGEVEEFVGQPVPREGLEYAGSFSFETLAGIELESEAVVPYLIAGELELLDDLDCDEAVARAEQEMAAVRAPSESSGGAGGEGGAGAGAGGGGGADDDPPEPPRLRVAQLSELPAPALSEGYSTLIVATGCLGGPAFSHVLDEDACGNGYRPDSPTLGTLLVLLPRASAPGKLTLSAFHASRAQGRLTVVAAPPASELGVSVTIATDLRFGALLPRLPFSELEPGDYGADTRTWRVQAVRDGSTLISAPWVDVIDRAGLDALAGGSAYTVVALGPASGIGDGGFWNDPALALVDNDPEP